MSVGRRLGRWIPRFWVRQKQNLLVFSIYLALTLVYTYPVILHLSTAIAGDGGDPIHPMWLMWWTKRSWFDFGTSPADLSVFYYPLDVRHPLLLTSPAMPLLAMPITVLAGPLVAHNLVFLASFALTSFTAYLLCSHLTRDRWAAFLGGLIMGFAPTRLMHARGHLLLVASWFLPLYVLFSVRLLRRPTRKNGLLAGGVLALAALVHVSHAVNFLLPYTICWLGYAIWHRRRALLRPPYRMALGLMFLLAFVIVLPFYGPLLWDSFQGRTDYLVAGGVTSFSAGVLNLFLPPDHVLYDVLGVRGAVEPLIGNATVESGVYLGLLPLALAVYGAVAERRRCTLWIVFALVSIVLALGPVLKIAADPVRIDIEGQTGYVLLPYAFLQSLPLIGIGRAPGRMGQGAMLAVAVLASFGLHRLLLRGGRDRIRLRRWVLLPVTVLVGFEFLVFFPHPVTPVEVPSFYRDLCREGQEELGILDYPLDVPSYKRTMFFQMTHQCPIAGGRAWRMPADGQRWVQLLDQLVASAGRPNRSLPGFLEPAESPQAWLSSMGYRYLVLQQHAPGTAGWRPRRPERVAEERAALTTWLPEPLYEDEQIVVFPIPSEELADDKPLAALGAGWVEEGVGVEGVPFYTLSEKREIICYTSTTSTLHLSFDAWAQEPARLHIALDTHPLLDTLVETRRTFVTPAITLTPGLSTIGFEGQEVHSMDDASAPPAVLWFSPFRWMGDGEMVGESGWTDVDVVFADTLRLLAYRLPTSSLQPGEDLWLELRWEMMRSVPENYKLFVHIIDMNGELLAQRDSEPLDARYHTSWLGAGEMVWDSFSISLPPGIPPGTYAVKAGWYDASSGERLSVDALQTTDASTAFILGTIELPSNR